MTNRELLQQVRPTLNILANGAGPQHDLEYDGASTTAVRYAVVQNQKRLQDALEGYNDLLTELLEEHDVEPTEQGGIPEDAPDEFNEALEDLLQQDAPFEPYTVTDADIKKEEGVPLELLTMMDWMIDDDE